MITINKGHINYVKNHLLRSFRDGYKWVAFDAFPYDQRFGNFVCTKTLDGLSDYCESLGHLFRPLSTILRAFRNESREHLVDKQKLAEQIAYYPIQSSREMLVAELKSQKPVLDRDGLPERNTALLLSTASLHYDHVEKKLAYQIQDTENLVLKQPMLACFNTGSCKLEFFNGKLDKVTAGSTIEYLDLSYFDFAHEKIAIEPVFEELKLNKEERQKLVNRLKSH